MTEDPMMKMNSFRGNSNRLEVQQKGACGDPHVSRTLLQPFKTAGCVGIQEELPLAAASRVGFRAGVEWIPSSHEAYYTFRQWHQPANQATEALR